MKKWLQRSVIAFGLVSCIGGSVFAFDSTNYTYYSKEVGGNVGKGNRILIYDNYTNAALVEHFAGTDTASGGTTSISAGLVDVSDMPGSKYVFLKLSAITGGTFTPVLYEFYGTSTVNSTTGTRNAHARWIANWTAATSTVLAIAENCTYLAVANRMSSAGTATFSAGLEYLIEK